MYATNYVPVRDMQKSLTGCCPPFEPMEWDGRTFMFHQKMFLKFTTHNLFHIPLNMSQKMLKVSAQITEADAASPDYLMLSRDISPWKSEHYIAVSKKVPNAEITQLNGKFLAKVFDGPFKNIRRWRMQLLEYVVASGKRPLKTYFSYTMCPQCAKTYGHNYVVGFEQFF